MRIRWSEPAVADLDNIKNYIAQDSDLYASRIIEGIILSAEQLLKFPEMGRKVPEADSDAIREVLFRNYRIIYRTTDLTILSVIHGARDISGFEKKPWEIT